MIDVNVQNSHILLKMLICVIMCVSKSFLRLSAVMAKNEICNKQK